MRNKHISLGAKMVPFAGYNMPLQYSGLKDEHLNVRNCVGVFDVSHMGEFHVRGEGSLEFLQHVTSNDVSKLFPGKVQYSCLPNDQGGIVDDLLVYMMAEDHYFLVVNASNIDKDWNWLQSHKPEEVVMENISDNISLLAIQGPKALSVVSKITNLDLSEMKYYTFKQGTVAGINNALISTTGYTGSGGFEIYVPNESALKLWDAVFESGASEGIKPAGLAARDTLRLEMGFCLYGNDINDETSPIEAGLGWITKFTKSFINSEELKEQKENGISSKLVGFEMIERGIPRQGYPILDSNGNRIGEVTSGTMSPSLDKGIGMGYVTTEHSEPEDSIQIEIRNKGVSAKVTRLPFYKP